MSNLQLFIPIQKVDEKKRLVYGTLTSETLDKSGEIFDYATGKLAIQKWSDDMHEATQGKSKGNLRAMHDNIAAGKFTDIQYDDENKKITGVAKIIDEDSWNKVLEGVFSGFSIGGGYAKRWNDPVNPTAKRYTPIISEVSIVDSPCVGNATFEFIKADGQIEMRKFNINEMEKGGPGSTRWGDGAGGSHSTPAAAGRAAAANDGPKDSKTKIAENKEKATAHRETAKTHIEKAKEARESAKEARANGKEQTAKERDKAADAHEDAAKAHEHAASMNEDAYSDKRSDEGNTAFTTGAGKATERAQSASSFANAKRTSNKSTNPTNQEEPMKKIKVTADILAKMLDEDGALTESYKNESLSKFDISGLPIGEQKTLESLFKAEEKEDDKEIPADKEKDKKEKTDDEAEKAEDKGSEEKAEDDKEIEKTARYSGKQVWQSEITGEVFATKEAMTKHNIDALAKNKLAPAQEMLDKLNNALNKVLPEATEKKPEPKPSDVDEHVDMTGSEATDVDENADGGDETKKTKKEATKPSDKESMDDKETPAEKSTKDSLEKAGAMFSKGNKEKLMDLYKSAMTHAEAIKTCYKTVGLIVEDENNDGASQDKTEEETATKLYKGLYEAEKQNSEALVKNIGQFSDSLAKALKRIEALEEQPLPAKGIVKAIAKTADGNLAGDSSALTDAQLTDKLSKMTKDDVDLLLMKGALSRPIFGGNK